MFKHQNIIIIDTFSAKNSGSNFAKAEIGCLPYGSINDQLISTISIDSPVLEGVRSSLDAVDSIITELDTLLTKIHQYSYQEIFRQIVGLASIPMFSMSKLPVLSEIYRNTPKRDISLGGSEVLCEAWQWSGTLSFESLRGQIVSQKYTIDSKDDLINTCLKTSFSNYTPKPDHQMVVFVDGVCRYSESSDFLAIEFGYKEPPANDFGSSLPNVYASIFNKLI
ncbi:hypothetical protein [Photobacterium leiognathi]|uniref:hypothetical protein n=1 Tax=Photobacterium leiognathi TaxID=553611 RepID=UPI002980DE2B|nr:hypothetical protein [Photobacterium leiognathi]